MWQLPKYDPNLSRTHRETYADMLKACEREFRDPQKAFETDDSNENRARYCLALSNYDRAQKRFRFVAAPY